MVSYVLHIGRHKSGTTSIQHALAEHADALLQRRILYPQVMRASINHGDMARVMVKADDEETIAGILAAVEAEARDKGCDRVILSSEVFQQLRRRPFDILRRLLADKDVQVVCYVRHPHEYFLSTYQQAVFNTWLAQTAGEYFTYTYRMDLPSFLAAWKDAWGDAFSVAVFDRKVLRDGDVVTDFLHRIGLSDMAMSSGYEANPSISGNLLLYKLACNYIPEKRWPRVPLLKVLDTLAFANPLWRGRFRTSQGLAERIVQAQQRQVDVLRETYGLAFPAAAYPTGSPASFTTLAADLEAIHAQVAGKIAGGPSLDRIHAAMGEILAS